MAILEKVKNIVVKILGVSESDIKPESRLVDDLGADSLDLMEILMVLEEKFSSEENPLTIYDEEAQGIKTIQDIVDYFKSKGITDE